MVYPSASIASSVSSQLVVPQTVHLSVTASAFYCVSCVGISSLPHCNSKISLKYQSNKAHSAVVRRFLLFLV